MNIPAAFLMLLTGLVLGSLSACTRDGARDAVRERPEVSLAAIQQRGELRVATVKAPWSWYLGTHSQQGLEYLLARDFARQLGVKLRIVPLANRSALRAALLEGHADLAAAHLTHSAFWGDAVLAAKPYDEVALNWVYRRGQPRPALPGALPALQIVVADDTPEAALLERYATQSGMDLQWIAIATSAQLSPLEVVAVRRADLALIDSRRFDFLRSRYPELAIAGTLPIKRPVQWIVAPGGDALVSGIDEFFAAARRSNLLQQRIAESVEDVRRMRLVTALEFKSLTSERLPPLQPFFEQASVQTGFDWRLLAALAYQESQWNPRAISPDGAEGIMMLMPLTAASLNVDDPFDARGSILAGARYLAQVREQIPARIPEPDRTWFAIAAYNMGYGHIESARVLAQKRGANPDSWEDVRLVLPLLSVPEWFLQVETGYARGWEAQHTVDRVRQFAAVLVWSTTEPATF